MAGIKTPAERRSKVKVAHITPTPLIEAVLGPADDYHLCLTEMVLNDDAYRMRYHRRMLRGDFIMLDNGAFEHPGVEPSLKDLEQAAFFLTPAEIILPDVIGGTVDDNIKMAVSGAKHFRGKSKFVGTKMMAVPQGPTIKEFMRCVEEMARIPGVTTIGIGYGATKHLKVPRPHIYNVAQTIAPQHAFHFLGCYPDMSDFEYPEVNHRVRGIDTCKFIRYGLACLPVTLEKIPEYPGRGDDYFQTDATDPDQLQMIQQNMLYWRTHAR